MYRIDCLIDNNNTEIIEALLLDSGFEASMETENGFALFAGKQLFKDRDLSSVLNDISSKFPFKYTVMELEDINWNARWESSFKAVEIGNWCRVRAPFHQTVKGFEHEIILQPKMAFGTGHHETTYLMLERMKAFDLQGKVVLDYGAGTGILAILASRLKAKEITAIDIDIQSFENIMENAEMNQCGNITAVQGDITSVPDKNYDCILANINRNVLLESFENLNQFMVPGGTLLISGILIADEPNIRLEVKKYDWDILYIKEKNNWSCMEFRKPY